MDYIRSYHTVDKTSWPDGPWKDEIDKSQWVDPDTGLDCLIVRNPVGSLCGYVGIPSNHPWHGKDYNQCTLSPPCVNEEDEYCSEHYPAYLTRVHGGLTFSGLCSETEDESVGICHVPLPGRPDDVFWFGFDCAHFDDVMPATSLEDHWRSEKGCYKTEEYVQEQCASLAKQLVNV
jgi:hypothetical protein